MANSVYPDQKQSGQVVHCMLRPFYFNSLNYGINDELVPEVKFTNYETF